MATTIQPYLDKLAKLDFSRMYNEDFLLTWEKSTDELQALYAVADALRNLRERNISTRLFESGLAVSLFVITQLVLVFPLHLALTFLVFS